MSRRKNPLHTLRAGVVLQFVLAVVCAAILLVPLGTSVLGGFKKNSELMMRPFGLPAVPQTQNYTNVLASHAFWRQLENSVFVMTLTTFGVVALAAMAAYVFARLQFRGRDVLYNFFTLGLMFPTAVAILPLYLTIRSAGMVDTYWGIILPQIGFGLPLTIIVLRGFFAQIPKEIEEAAAIDGASIMGMFFYIVLPIVRPALASMAVLVMVSSWNAFFWPLLVINSTEMYTLPLGVMQFSSQFGTDYGRVLAFVTLSMVPAIAFYLVAERQIVSGLTAGAMKG